MSLFCERSLLFVIQWHPGGYLGFEVTGLIEGFFGVQNFRFRDFLGTKIWQVFFG